MPNTMAYNFLI